MNIHILNIPLIIIDEHSERFIESTMKIKTDH